MGRASERRLINNVPDLETRTSSPRSPGFPPTDSEPPAGQAAVPLVGWGGGGGGGKLSSGLE